MQANNKGKRLVREAAVIWEIGHALSDRKTTKSVCIQIQNFIYYSHEGVNDILGTFILKGNKYRLDVKVSYKSQVVLVNRIGTHAEYSKWKF